MCLETERVVEMKRKNVIAGIVCGISVLAGAVYVFQTHTNQDTEGPKLEAEKKEITVSIQATEEELMSGITATDNTDGDVSDSIVIEHIQKKETGAGNEFEVTYVAFDKASNPGRLTRTLFYEDYHRPRFQIVQQLRFPENQKLSIFDYITVEDCIDGDISPFITLKGNASIPEKPQKGIYECTLQVINSIGDLAELPIQIEVYEDSYEERTFRPKMTLTENIVYVSAGTTIDPYAYVDSIYDQGTKQVKMDEELAALEDASKYIGRSAIAANVNVDWNTPGVYTIIYTYHSGITGYDCNACLYVVVE